MCYCVSRWYVMCVCWNLTQPPTRKIYSPFIILPLILLKEASIWEVYIMQCTHTMHKASIYIC